MENPSVRPCISIVTPAYNESENLPLLYRELCAVLDQMPVDWEWLVVDDHSSDTTFGVLQGSGHGAWIRFCDDGEVQAVADWLKRHVESAEIRWLQPGRDDIEEAMADMERFSDQRISFTDATSFALMRRHKIDRVFGFDRKFAAAGFALWPEGEK